MFEPRKTEDGYIFFNDLVDNLGHKYNTAYRRYTSLPDSCKKEILLEGKTTPTRLISQEGALYYCSRYGTPEQGLMFAKDSLEKTKENERLAAKVRENQLLLETQEAQRQRESMKRTVELVDHIHDGVLSELGACHDQLKLVKRESERGRIVRIAQLTMKVEREGLSYHDFFEKVNKIVSKR